MHCPSDKELATIAAVAVGVYLLTRLQKTVIIPTDEKTRMSVHRIHRIYGNISNNMRNDADIHSYAPEGYVANDYNPFTTSSMLQPRYAPFPFTQGGRSSLTSGGKGH